MPIIFAQAIMTIPVMLFANTADGGGNWFTKNLGDILRIQLQFITSRT